MFLLFNCIFGVLALASSYDVPPAKVEVFYPKGFRVSIPASKDFQKSRLYFGASLNEEIKGFWAADGARWVSATSFPTNDCYTFEEEDAALKIGDILYYWIYVIYDRDALTGNATQSFGKYVVNYYSNVEPSRTEQNTTDTTMIRICSPSNTFFNKKQVVCQGDLIFEEYFDGSALNSSVWMQEHRFSSEPDYEFVMYMKHSNALTVKNGFATIKPLRRDGDSTDALRSREFDFGPSCTGQLDSDDCVRTNHHMSILPPLISAQFSTKNSFNFRYGRVEVRARLPHAEWVFPQITLEPVSFNTYGKEDYKSGQIRVAFTKGGATCNLEGGVLLNSERPFRTTKMCNRQCDRDEWSKDFHVYSLNWTPNNITIYVDGVQYCFIDPGQGFATLQLDNQFLPNAEHLKKGTRMAPFDQEFYLRIGYGVGGIMDFADGIPNKPWRNVDGMPMYKFWKNMLRQNSWLTDEASELQIDYIKVFAV